MNSIVENEVLSNSERASKLEQFILDQAVEVGVVKKVEFAAARNPNKWNKQMAPWFTESCKVAKQQYIRASRTHGRHSEEAESNFKLFRHACLQGKKEFAQTLPNMLKYQPKQFWGLLKRHRTQDANIDLEKFAKFNQKLFHDESA